MKGTLLNRILGTVIVPLVATLVVLLILLVLLPFVSSFVLVLQLLAFALLAVSIIFVYVHVLAMQTQLQRLNEWIAIHAPRPEPTEDTASLVAAIDTLQLRVQAAEAAPPPVVVAPPPVVVDPPNVNALVEERVLTRVAELQARLEDAQERERAKSRFLANISHGVRTPMNAIAGMAELLMAQKLTSTQRRYVEDIKLASSYLMDMVNDLLDLSDIETGRLALAPVHFSLHQLIDNVASLTRFALRGKHVGFALSMAPNLPTVLVGDSMRLRQILLSVLNNAVKYTLSGHINWNILCDKNNLTFIIEDTGVGIAEEEHTELFTPIKRRNTGRQKGTALGLSITKHLVDLMKGTIDVQSVLGKGTTVTVTVPYALGNQSDLDNENNRFQFILAPAAKILIVDDSVVNLEVAKGLLGLCGIRNCDLAKDGQTAVELATKKEYDLIFMDHMMPGMDGVETTITIHGIKPDVPIVALTANVVDGAKEMLLTSGMSDFIAKPIEKEELNRILLTWLPTDLLVTRGSSDLTVMDESKGAQINYR